MSLLMLLLDLSHGMGEPNVQVLQLLGMLLHSLI